MKKQNNLHLVIVIFLGVLFFNILTSCSSGDSSKSENSYFTNNVAKDSTMHVNGIVNKNGVKLYYEVVGSGKDTLVFLHGTPSTMYAFVKDLESFSNYFTMIFYDQRGGGRSSLILNPDSLTWQENVKDLEAIRAYFNINKLNILGISWGSALAALYADTFPDNIKSLILFPMRARKNPGVPKNAKPRQPLLDSLSNKRMNELREQWESADDPIAICEEYWSIISPTMFHDSINVEKLKGSFCQEPPEVIRYTWKVSNAKMSSLGDFDLRPKLAKINSRALIIKGVSASMYHQWTEEWAAWLPNSRMLWVDSAGLFPWVEKPQFILEVCKIFINGEWPETSKIIENKQVEE